MKIFDEIFPINENRSRILKKLNTLIQKDTPEDLSADSQLTSREIDVLKLLVRE
jgi:DNA-binding NarL/FixJ family response regulator